MIRYAETYEIVTPESAEHGDYAESGFTHDPDMPLELESFSELVDLLEGTQPSQWPIQGGGDNIWFTTGYAEPDPRTGESEYRSYHPLTARDSRYFLKAWRYANK